MRLFFLLSALFCLTTVWGQGFDEKLSVPVWTTVSETPSVTLHWIADPLATSYPLQEK